jgi:hypothetical protein
MNLRKIHNFVVQQLSTATGKEKMPHTPQKMCESSKITILKYLIMAPLAFCFTVLQVWTFSLPTLSIVMIGMKVKR